MPRSRDVILRDIDSFNPHESSWLVLENLLAELWCEDVPASALPHLFRIFERFPKDDGAGVLWSVLHGIEALPFDYEQQLRASLMRRNSFMGNVMLERLEKSKSR
jgi:hypothetical protein